MFEAHHNRIAEIDEELARANQEIDDLLERSLSHPEAYQEQLERARSRRAIFERERADRVAGIEVLAKRERSAARVAARQQGRDFLRSALASPDERARAAANLDQAAQAFLAAMDEMRVVGDASQSAVKAAVIAAIPMDGAARFDQNAADKVSAARFALYERALHHAGGFTGIDMQYALVLFIAEILRRAENPKRIAEIAPGWQFTPGETVLTFADAAQAASESLAHGAKAIAETLVEPT